MAMCPAARDFFVRQGDLTQKYFVYFKSNQRRMPEKDPSIGYADIFQTSPKNLYSKPKIHPPSDVFGYEYRFEPAAGGGWGGKRRATASRPLSYRAAMVPPIRSVRTLAMDRPSPVEPRPVSTV